MTNDELACRAACHDLMVKLADGLDRRANEEVAALFTDDGGLVPPGGSVVSGPDLLVFLSKRSADVVTHHILSNELVRQIDEATAEAQAYVAAYRSPGRVDDLPRPLPKGPHGMGWWRLRYRKTAQGWRISRFETSSKFTD